MASHLENLKPPVQKIGLYILCGGASSRMGQCKTTVSIREKTMLQHLLDQLIPLGYPISLVGKETQRPLLQQYDTGFVADHNQTRHPLNGVIAALDDATLEHLDSVLILPCDTPFLQTSSLQRLLEHLPSVAIAPDDQIHPLIMHLPLDWLERAEDYRHQHASMKRFAEGAISVRISHDQLQNINAPSDIPSSPIVSTPEDLPCSPLPP